MCLRGRSFSTERVFGAMDSEKLSVFDLDPGDVACFLLYSSFVS